MKTNFFEQIAGLQINGTLQINIQPQEGGTLTVSVLLANNNPRITAGKNIPPMLLKATTQELDEKFFTEIGEPAKQTVRLFANLEAYQAELDKAKKQPEKTGKTTTVTAKKSADNSLFSQPAEEPDNDADDDLEEQPDETEALAEKQRLYDEAIRRVGQLNTDMKYKEAIAQLPDAEEYPDKAGEIKTKREALEKRQELYASLQTEV
ncbi:PRTRC system protein E [Mucilaginibacter sp. BJC16-A38]|uniref:PRTRC system protein E n=1 Tax=Mucilaginibacter phenanthrenivorans TaxID=1234842 RepID=UPI002157CB0F|nr:PRTRC system protein E [Mucilaginibacter phenanthrenivorans]MCR8557364.1 PRTRC system protein E [Mucilaginibacter phenanthrenivorans]